MGPSSPAPLLILDNAPTACYRFYVLIYANFHSEDNRSCTNNPCKCPTQHNADVETN